MKRLTFWLFLSVISIGILPAQNKENPYTFKNTNPSDSTFAGPDPNRYKTKLIPSMIPPAIFIGYGIYTIGDHGFYSSYQCRSDIQRLFRGDASHIDNVLVFSPYVEFAALLALKIKCRNDAINTALLIAKSEVLYAAIVFPMKYIVQEERPYSYALGLQGVSLSDRKKDPNAFVSMPSGHTAEAFLAATIVYREFRYKSPWYGVGAYALATSVALYRMINDQHWESDVCVGAGIGLFCANIVYATHLHRWGRKEVCFAPSFGGNTQGFSFACRF